MGTLLHTLFFFLLVTQIGFAQWDVLNESLVGPLNSIDFVDENVGWIAGSNGTLEKTIDGGENWNKITINENQHFDKIDFLNESIGWATGGSFDIPVIRKTSDGGLTWFQQLTNIGFGDLYVIDENNVYAVGNDTIFKTTNGGINWIDISPNLPNRNYNSLWFQDAYTGVVVGSYNDGTADRGIVMKTSNGGSSWNETIVNEFNSIYDLQFLDNSNGYFRAHLDTATYLCKTEDMFSSWSVIMQAPLKSYHFVDKNTAYAIVSTETSHILKSIDGGINWFIIYTPIEGISFDKIYFNKLSTGFISGFQGRIFEIFRSTDYGLNWKLEDFSIPLIDVSFVEENKAFMLGGYSWGHGDSYGGEYTILATSDGGSEWNTKFAIHGYILSYYLMNDSIGFIILDRPWWSGNWLLKTTDFGDSWIDVTPVSGFSGSDIIFQNDLTGWIVGDKIYKTTDCGASWYVDYTDSLEGFHLRSISLASTTIWAVGNIGFDGEGVMIKYTPQTGWVKQTSLTNLLLKKVVFLDDNNGWIAGGAEWVNGFTKIFLKTTDGGLNWNAIPNIPYLMRDLQYIDSNIGWAIGYTYDYSHQGEGGILKTTDGGITWSLNLSMTNTKFSGINFLDENNGWAVGENGIILHTTNGGNPVPVELNSFTATANNKEITLNWSTATELNNQGFEVQRKFGSNEFLTIGSVKGHGTAASPNQYTYVDKLLTSGKYFYRLKQIDFGGKVEYSKTVEINWSPFTTYKLEQNYPNPFNPTTTIGFGIMEKGNVRISVLNILGEEIKVLLNEEKEAGYHSIALNASDLPSGVYFYQLKAGSFIETKKIILLR